MCDLAYVLQLEQIERQVLADRQGLIARGATKDLPNLHTEQAAFDAWLNAEPEEAKPLTEADVIKLEERMALGVA